MRFAALLAAVCISGYAGADESSSGHACARIADRESRLACYDAIFSPPGASTPASKAAAAAPRPAVEQFGESGRARVLSEIKSDVPKQIDVTVRRVQGLPNGFFRLTLDNGQIWVTKESDDAIDFTVGDAVTIDRTLLGGYRISHRRSKRNLLITRIY